LTANPLSAELSIIDLSMEDFANLNELILLKLKLEKYTLECWKIGIMES